MWVLGCSFFNLNFLETRLKAPDFRTALLGIYIYSKTSEYSEIAELSSSIKNEKSMFGLDKFLEVILIFP